MTGPFVQNIKSNYTMKINTTKFYTILIVAMLWGTVTLFAQSTITKPKVIVTTDMGADPDDEQSMVRFLVSCNEFDVKGLIVSTSCWKTSTNTSVMNSYMNPLLNAYTSAYNNLKIHSADFPTPAYLKSITVLGNTGYAYAGIGSGKDSPGSNLIIATVDATTPDQPICVQSWGGSNTLAQALWKVKSTRSAAELNAFISKVYCYDILGQDNTGAWLVVNFPNLIYIRATNVYGWQRSKSDSWWATNIQSHGALGAVYPDGKYAMEGDTPALLHALGRGLNDPADPKQRGWGGQFVSKVANIKSMSPVTDEGQWGTYYMYGNSLGPQEFKQAIENDFQARMDWANSSNFSSANHHPIVSLNDDKTEDVLKINVAPGKTMSLSASGTTDPDNNTLTYKWTYYQTDGTYSSSVLITNSTSQIASITVPSNATDKTMHFVVAVTDNGSPSLTSYRRVIIVGNANGAGTSPVVNITSPANNSSANLGTDINLAATATDADGTVSKVEFFNGTTLLGTDITSPYTFSWTPTSAGNYSITAKATDNIGNTTTSSSVTISINAPRVPYNNVAHAIPGIIPMEEFDFGGNGVGYLDNTPGSEVTPVVNFRTDEDVDIETCSDAGGGYNIGYATKGEWLEYTVNVQSSGNYDLNLRVACNGDGRTVSLAMDGKNIATDVAIPNTAGWQTWTTITVKNIALTAGQKIMRLTIGTTDYVNLNFVEFKKTVVTGIENSESVILKMYPNPFGAEGFIINQLDKFSYRINDVSGILLDEGSGNGSKQIGQNLPHGVYFLTIENDKGTMKQKIVRQF
jgi:hypothetical protein